MKRNFLIAQSGGPTAAINATVAGAVAQAMLSDRVGTIYAGVNGIKGVQMIRELDAEVPIIVFTIDESQEVANRFIEAGASDFALKPIKVPDIISRIRLHIRLMSSNQRLKNKTQAKPSAAPPVKGIGPATLDLIEGAFQDTEEFLTVEALSQRTGLAYQTTYRYLQHMVSQGLVEVSQSYGKVGRPKQKFRLKK